MKPFILLLLLAPLSARAAVTFTQTFNVSATIPDNNDTGYASNRTLTAGAGGVPAANEITTITDLTVDLAFTGGWNGDLYVCLIHESGFSVLLNRIGRSAGNTVGSGSSGMTLTLSDAAVLDVHGAAPNDGLFAGTFQPDGRETDPATVLGTDARTAYLSSFNGLNAAGDWTLFVADLGEGDQSTLQSWSLTVSAVPEPSSILLGLVFTLPLLKRRR